MIGVRVKLAHNKADEQAELISHCKTIAKYAVWKEYNKNGIVSPSKEDLAKDYKTASDEIIATLKHDPDRFRQLVYNFTSEYKNVKTPESMEVEAETMRKQLDVINASGKVRENAPQFMAARMIEHSTRHSGKELGVDMNQYYGKSIKSKKRLFSGILTGKNEGIFDPNTKSTTEENKAERGIDRDLFKSNKFYRQVLEDDIKRIKKRGGLSEEENALINEHNRLQRLQNGKDKEKLSESDKILKSMTAGEKAMYDIAKIPFSMAKGIFKFATKSRKSTTISEDVPIQVEPIPSKQLDAATSVKSSIQPRDPKTGRFMKKEKSTDIESAESTDSASKESTVEKSSDFDAKILESSNKQIEILHKQLDMLGKIDEDGKTKSDGGGLMEVVSGFGKILPVLETAGAAIAVAGSAFAGFKVGEKLMNLTGQTDDKGNVKAGSWTDKATSWLAGVKTPEESSKEYEASDAGKKQLAEIADRRLAKKQNLPYEVVQGTTDIRNKGEKEYFDAVNSGDTEGAKLTAETLGYTPVKKNIASKLEEKQTKADVAKEEKVNANMAGAVSNVVNNSPNNSVVTPPPKQSRGRDTPRNPDNSLGDYLKSRVLKFT